jgi:hypothetical protein
VGTSKLGSVSDMSTEPSPAEDFGRRALEFCAHLEPSLVLERAPFVRQLAIALAQLYASALRLPDVAAESNDLLPRAVSDARRRALCEALSNMLGESQVYWEVFDPLIVADADAVVGDIVDDLVDIYCDLQTVIPALAHPDALGSPSDVLWAARFDFVNHWSRHATSCLKALDALLRVDSIETPGLKKR